MAGPPPAFMAASQRLGLGRAALLLAVAAATLLVLAAASDGQCDATSGANCAPGEVLAEGAAEGGAAAPSAGGLAEEDFEDLDGGNGTNGTNGTRKRRELDGVGIAGLCVVLGLFVFVILWIVMTIKYACDGSLAARLALWGLLPEAYAAISVKSVVALLRLKTEPTPVIVLRNCVTDEGARELAEAYRAYGRRADLQAIELPHNPGLTEAGVRALVEVALMEGSNLQELDLSYNPQLGGGLVEGLAPLLRPRASKINSLKLADCGLKAADVQRLADAAGRSGLRTLDLSWNELRGGGEALACTLEAPVLEELTLTCCELSLEDVQAVAETLPYTSLRSLQLGGNRIGASGLRAVAEQLPRSHVDEIGMEANDLEAGDLAPLAAAWAKRPFSRVRLSGNRMTQEEVASFVRTLKSLR